MEEDRHFTEILTTIIKYTDNQERLKWAVAELEEITGEKINVELIRERQDEYQAIIGRRRIRD